MATNFDARLANYSSPLLSIFRIVVGLAFTLHGSMKLFGWPLGQSVPVGTWPFWWAGLIEFVLGILITVGLFTRIAALIASGEMAVAYLWQHLPNGFWPYDAGVGGNGGEPALLYCLAFLALAGLGAGTLSVDARRRGRMGGVGGAGAVAPNRVVTGSAAPAGYHTGQPVRRGGLLSRFRRPRY